jgi:hypothetical protein
MPLKRPRYRWEDNVKMDFREGDVRVCSGFIWLLIGTSGNLFSTH